MKFNNNGFSLSTMIVFIVILLFVVILVSVLAYNYGHNDLSFLGGLYAR